MGGLGGLLEDVFFMAVIELGAGGIWFSRPALSAEPTKKGTSQVASSTAKEDNFGCAFNRQVQVLPPKAARRKYAGPFLDDRRPSGTRL